MTMNARRASWIFVVAGLVSQSAFAVRTAIFPAEIRNRATIWRDQDRIFNAETGEDTTRPIWVHGGDSLSSAWANGPSLRAKVTRAETSTLPQPRTTQDFLESLPDARKTWYAGSRYHYGVLGFLDALANRPWVIVSSALAGARFSHRNPDDALADEDSVRYMTEIAPERRARVKLVTFSLGNNDVCDGLNPAVDRADFTARLRTLKTAFPNTVIVPFMVMPVRRMYAGIMARLDALPPTLGRDRTKAYCQAMWQLACPAALQDNAELEAARTETNDILRAEFGNVFDPMPIIQGADLLDIVSGDCFHPSGATEEHIIAPLDELIRTRLNP